MEGGHPKRPEGEQSGFTHQPPPLHTGELLFPPTGTSPVWVLSPEAVLAMACQGL